MIYFHRRAGLAFIVEPDKFEAFKDHLRADLGDKFVEGEWDTISSHGHLAIRVRAVLKGHLDVTTISDESIFAG